MGEGKSGRKIMVVVDESDASYHALSWVLENLKEDMGSSSLVLVTVRPLPVVHFVFGVPLAAARLYFPGAAGPDLLNPVRERTRIFSAALLKKAESICTSRGVKVETLNEETGDPGTAICSAAAEHKIDLLVFGCPFQSLLERIFRRNRSPSDYCLEKAGCPVLVVKKKK